ncbi:MAG: putative ABC transporter permease [Clostridia bacterium]|nr:putative ABC transporter permease [Clostridia bacterium]
MLSETVLRYTLYFFFYSAAGWLIESCYCSVRPRKWVNRGFLTGPLCPIYGTGSLVFLVFVLPIKNNVSLPVTIAGRNLSLTPVLVFFAGLVLADIVEFTVSLMMEKMFHARWWDYSENFLNIQGRICFKHSIYWGLASIGFLYVIHPFVNRFFIKIPVDFVEVALAVILIIFVVDVFDAIRKAMDVRALIDKIKKFRTDLSAQFGSTFEDILAMGEDEIKEFYAKAVGHKNDIADRMNEIKESFEILSKGFVSKDYKQKGRYNRMFAEFPMIRAAARAQLDNIEINIEKVKNKIRSTVNKDD